MSAACQIPHAVEKILAASHCGCAYIGGSLTVGVGASNVATRSWRALFTRHLYRAYHPIYQCQVSEIMGAVGAMESPVAAFTLTRNVLPCHPDLAFIEFCVNDAQYRKDECHALRSGHQGTGGHGATTADVQGTL